MGSYENVQATTIPGIPKFVLSLYSTQKFQINNCKTTDIAKTNMVCSGQKNAARMPMCEKVLKQHINRTNILAFLIKSPLLLQMLLCKCKEMGWRCTLACGCERDCLNLPATHYEADSDSDDENN